MEAYFKNNQTILDPKTKLIYALSTKQDQFKYNISEDHWEQTHFPQN